MEATIIEDDSTPQDTPEVVEDLQSQEPYEPPKRGPGRPPKNPNKIAVTLPKPPAFQIKKPQTFVEYWKSLNKQQAESCLIRVYRLWPVINNKQLNPESNNDIDTIPGEDCFFGAPDEWEDSLLHRYGSGWYQLYLNHDRASVCRVVMKTQQDLTNRPPKITSGTLVEGHPDNAGYVQYLRDRGLYKDERNEAEQMQANESINKLTDTVITMASRAQVPLPPAPNNDRVISELVKPMMGMMADANKSAIESVKAQASGADPLATIGAIGTVLKELRGNGGGDETMKMFLQDSIARAQASEKRSNELLDRLLTRETTPPASPMATIKETLDIINSMREAASNKDDGDGGSKGNSLAQSLIEALPVIAPPILGMIDRGMQIFQMMRQPAPQQLHSQQTAQQPQGPVNPYGGANGTTPMQQAVKQEMERQANGGTGAPPTRPIVETAPINPATNMPYTPEEIAEAERKRAQYAQFHGFLQGITQPVINHMNDPESDGYDFAEWFVKGQSRLMYDNIKGVGEDVLLEAIKTFPPLWTQVAGIEPKFKQFIHEFMTYDEEMARVESEENEEGNE